MDTNTKVGTIILVLVAAGLWFSGLGKLILWEEATVRFLDTGSKITVDAADYSFMAVGDTVQLESINGRDWEVDNQASTIQDTSYTVPGPPYAFSVQRRPAVVLKKDYTHW